MRSTASARLGRARRSIVKFGIFYEHQNPRPWQGGRSEQELLFSGRFEVEGDLSLATRVPEMFGAPPQF